MCKYVSRNFVLLCFISPILGNRYGPSGFSKADQGKRTIEMVSRTFFFLIFRRRIFFLNPPLFPFLFLFLEFIERVCGLR